MTKQNDPLNRLFKMTKREKSKLLQAHLINIAGVKMTLKWCNDNLEDYVFTDDGIFHVNELASQETVDSELDTQDNEPKIEPQLHNQDISEATVTSEVEPVHSEIDSNESHNEPDGDDLHYPSEIDSPDPDFDHDTPEVDYPDYQLLLDKFKEQNPHFTILESKFFTVPYWHLTEQKLLIFGYGGDGDKWNVFSVISFTKTRTNHIFDGDYQQCRMIYHDHCENTANFKVYEPRQKDPILERYKHELTTDYRVFTRKQLALF